MNDTIKYLAGIFDAEGYVRIRKTESNGKIFYTPEVKIYMTNKKIVSLFSNIYKIPIKKDTRGVNRKIAYRVTWGVKILKSTSFIDDFLPYLNEKRLQLEEVKNIIDGKNKEECYQRYMVYKKSFDHPVNKDMISYAYLAGIIDGDGWITMFNSSKDFTKFSLINRWRIGLEQRYKPMIEYLSQIDSSMINERVIKDRIAHIQTYSWQSSTSKILPFLIKIEPFLIEKKEKCKALIRYITEYEKFKQIAQDVLEEWK